jgi:triosephosphate isomerase
MTKKIIAGNWKQNGNFKSSIKLTKDIISEVKKNNIKHDVIIFPPNLYLLPIKSINKNEIINIGSQNVSAYNDGAFTGEISATMLNDSKIKYCLVGHSERRHILNENDLLLSDKVSRLHENNIKVIYCIGETLEEYKSKKTKTILKKQIKSLFSNLNKSKKYNKVIIAYEPVWAIGTGLIPSAKELSDTFRYINNTVTSISQSNKSIKLLYGGSVSPDNAKRLMETNYIDGLLIGGASLKAKKFIDICSTI